MQPRSHEIKSPTNECNATNNPLKANEKQKDHQNKKRYKLKYCTCDDMYKLSNSVVLNKYHKFLETLSTCSLENVNSHVRDMQQCGAEHNLPDKLGHPKSCYEDCASCKST